MDIVLHLGAHRSGSTTLQEYLRRQRAGLAASGVRALLPASLRGAAYHGLLQRNGAGPAGAALAATLAQARAAGTRNLLISDENISGSLRTILRDGRLYPGLGARLARLAPALGNGPQRIGLAVRPYAGWWESVLAFAVAQGLHIPEGGEGARLSGARRGWADVAAEIARVFPAAEIVVWRFDDLAGRPRLVAQALTGAELPGAGPVLRNNAAPDAAVLRRRLQAAGLADAARHLPQSGRWQVFTPAQRRELAARHAADLARIARMGSVRLIAAPQPQSTAPGQPCAPHPPEGGASDGRSEHMA